MRQKPNIKYRVEINVVPGLIRRNRGFKTWTGFASPTLGVTLACMSKEKAEKLYRQLKDFVAANVIK